MHRKWRSNIKLRKYNEWRKRTVASNVERRRNVELRRRRGNGRNEMQQWVG